MGLIEKECTTDDLRRKLNAPMGAFIDERLDEDIFEEVSLDQPTPKRERINPLREIASLTLYVVLLLSLTYLLVTYVVQRTVVEGSSMNATLSDGDSVLLDKLSYRFSDPERFDIVVFDYMYKLDTRYIKRIIGLPGESVLIQDGYVYIDQHDGNGFQKLEGDIYGNEVIDWDKYGLAETSITLGEDEYFVLGDNRNNSHDSRKEDVGNITKDQIVGKAVVRIWPLTQITWLGN